MRARAVSRLLLCAALAAPAGVFRPAAAADPVLAVPGPLLLAQALPAPARRFSAVAAGYNQAYADLIYHFWDSANPIPRIRPTRGNGSVDNAAPLPTFWQMAEMASLLYWHGKLTGNADARAMLQSQFNEVRRAYTATQLSSADWKANRGIINVSDDAALAITFFVQVHDATGDPAALQIAKALVDSTYAFFADPNRSEAGILYAVPGQDPAHQGVSQLIEALTARAALYVYQKTGQAAYRDHAVRSWNWMHQYLKHPTGVYFCELDLRPTVNGAPNPGYRRPVGHDRPGDIRRGGSVAYIGGTMAMASLSAALFLQTGEQQYLDEVNSIVAGMLRPDTFLRPGAPVGVPGSVFVNDRDAWSDGYFVPQFVADVLALSGVDADNRWKAALEGTALSIIRQRTPDGFYGPDWSGPEADPSGAYRSWVAQGMATAGAGGSGGGMAVPAQLPTSASSVAVLLGAATVESWAQRR